MSSHIRLVLNSCTLNNLGQGLFPRVLTLSDKALVKSLTLNGIKRAVTVAAEDHVTILLVCQTFGRPRPTDVKLTNVNNESFADAHMAQVSKTGMWRRESTVTFSDVQCSDMGTYVCTASNGVGPADSRSVVLSVRCES